MTGSATTRTPQKPRSVRRGPACTPPPATTADDDQTPATPTWPRAYDHHGEGDAEAHHMTRRLAAPILIARAVSDRGGKYASLSPHRQDTYRALRRKGKSKRAAAAISNAGRTHLQRSRMAKKAARTRRRRGGR